MKPPSRGAAARLRCSMRVLCGTFMAVALIATIPAAAAAPGLSVSNGVLLLEGKPFQGVGANYFSLFSSTLGPQASTASQSNLAALARAGIPFVRFMCGGFWPVEQNLFVTNRSLFFERLDRIVRCAESNHIGLIPSLFWHTPTVCDLAGEPLRALGQTNSRSIAFVRGYTREVVSRYRTSAAIWAWEFGNELNLAVDLPNASQHRPPLHPRLGTPSVRSPEDELRNADMITCYKVFAETVRSVDRHRMITSGNSVPRPSAWHNSYETNWKPDTAAQFRQILARDNPDPMDSISVHIYAGEAYAGGARNLGELIELASNYARQHGKPLLVGEFGVSREAGNLMEQRAKFKGLLVSLRDAKVPLAAFWVFDLPSQEKDWNCSFGNDRRFMIELAAEANRTLHDQRRSED